MMRFRAAPLLPSALAMALFALLRPATAYVLGRVDADATAKVRLFEHVLRNDRDWRLVLDQRIVLTDANRPPYGLDCADGDDLCAGRGDHVRDPAVRELVRLLDAGASDVTAATVLQRVVNRFAWLGSYVHYAAYVLRIALTCVTYTFVSLQIDLLILRENVRNALAASTKTDEPASTTAAQPAADTAMEDQWAMLAVFVDKLASTHGDLRQLAVLSVVLTEFANPNSGYDHYKEHLLRLVKQNMDAAIDRNCVRAQTDDLYVQFGVKRTHAHLEKDAVNKDPGCIAKAYDQASVTMMDLYDGLNIVTTGMDHWKQILDYQLPVTMGVNFYMQIDEALKNDDVGKQILMKKWKLSEDAQPQATEDNVVPVSYA